MNSDSYNTLDETLFILNEKNKKIPKTFIKKTVNKYLDKEYKIDKINELLFFQRAMVHRSYLVRDPNYEGKKSKIDRDREKDKEIEPIADPNKALSLQEASYERLEFLGDSVIHLIVADYLFHRYENQDEGFMTKLRTRIENKEFLAKLGLLIGLDEYVLISRRMEKHDARTKNPSIMEDCFEAFIGALYKNFGFKLCQNFIVNLLEKEVDFVEFLKTEVNHKDTLLQYYHKQKWNDPQYGMTDYSGPDHKKMFTMYVSDKDGKPFAYGIGLSKKKGEQMAAKNALIKYGLIEDENDNNDNDDDVESVDSDLSLSDMEIIDE